MSIPISRKGDSLKRVLFLCEDNHLKSRFCEELFNSLVRDEGLNWQAVSRALSPVAARRYRDSMAREAVACLRSLGAAPMNHGRLPLGATAFDFDMSFVAIAIRPAGRDARLRERWPDYASQIQIWPVDESLPLAWQLRDLAFAVGQMLDQMLGRGEGAATVLPVPQGPSAKIGTRAYTGSELSHVRSRQSVTGLGGGAPHPD
jgi:protein-tyrosine-phosphatase